MLCRSPSQVDLLELIEITHLFRRPSKVDLLELIEITQQFRSPRLSRLFKINWNYPII